MTDINEARQRWVEVTKGKEDMERKLLALIGHPEANMEQIQSAHQMYVGVCQLYAKAKDALMLKYPDTRTVVHPWNKRG